MQPYNACLSLASLAQHSSGVILTANDALSATCQQLLNIQRPGFADLNAVAARSLAGLLLPATQQQAPSTAAPAQDSGRRGGRSGGRGGAVVQARPPWDSDPSQPRRAPQPATAAAWDGKFSSGSRWEDEEPAGSSRGGAGCKLDALADVCDRLCGQPQHRLLTLRSGPTMPPASFDFTPFSWPNLLRDLRQTQLAGQGGAAGGGSLGSGGAGRPAGNRALGSLLVLRGDQAAAADAGCFADAALYSSNQRRLAVPLALAASGARLGGQQMLATLLSNDQASARLLRADQSRPPRCSRRHILHPPPLMAPRRPCRRSGVVRRPPCRR